MSIVRTPIRRSRSSIWSSACTAVVGSLIAGESALIATSASRRSANFRVLLHRSLAAEEKCPPDLVGWDRTATHLRDHRAARDGVADADADLDRGLCLGRELDEAPEVHGSDDERRPLVHDAGRTRAPGPRGRAPLAPADARRVRRKLVDHLPSPVTDQREDVREVHLAQRVVEKRQEEEHAWRAGARARGGP